MKKIYVMLIMLTLTMIVAMPDASNAQADFFWLMDSTAVRSDSVDTDFKNTYVFQTAHLDSMQIHLYTQDTTTVYFYGWMWSDTEHRWATADSVMIDSVKIISPNGGWVALGWTKISKAFGGIGAMPPYMKIGMTIKEICTGRRLTKKIRVGIKEFVRRKA